MIELELPFPPSVNHYYRRVGRRVLISREGRKFRERVCALIADLGLRTMSGPLQVEILAYPPNGQERDYDNIEKALFDALQHARVYHKDSQVKKHSTEECTCIPGGMVIVRIEARQCSR